MAEQFERIKRLLPGASRELFSRPNVVATGIGYKRVNGQKTGELCIVCSVGLKVSAASLDENEIIPPFFEGVPTDVRPVGLIHALRKPAGAGPEKPANPLRKPTGGSPEPLAHPFRKSTDVSPEELTHAIRKPTGRFRPAPGGVSTGHIHVSAGTLGCLVKKGEKVLILSNNHVLANSNQAKKGDMIIQPGLHDGGKIPADQIARLSGFVPIYFEDERSRGLFAGGISGIYNFFARLSGSRSRLYSRKIKRPDNLVDCAIAEPVNPKDVKNEILGAGIITGTAEGILDMEVMKSGRTTGLTTGVIEQVDVTVRVSFGSGKTALFTDQLMAGAMSQGGDSGSVVLNGENEAVGLLFAGSTTTTIINRIQNVFKLLEVELI